MTMPPPVPLPNGNRHLYNGVGSFYFDGDSPAPQPVILTVDRGTRVLEIEAQGRAIHWPLEDVRQVEDVAGKAGTVLRLTGDPLARLHLVNRDLLDVFPNLRRRAPPKGRGRLAAWAVGAIAAVALQITVLVPMLADRLAVFIPPEGERALGEATFGQIREALGEGNGMVPLSLCENEEGLDVLRKMIAKLTALEDLAQPVEVFVLDHEMVNAFALPGGYVVFFRGLIDAAQSPNEVGAVMAHEIGHVVSRDPTRHALRSAGSIGVLGLLFGDFAGGAAVLFLTERLIAAHYSQGAETGADVYAYGALERANVSPASLGDMFDRLRQKYGDSDGVIAHFITHPTLSERIDKARNAVTPGAQYGQIVDDADWEALKRVCD